MSRPAVHPGWSNGLLRNAAGAPRGNEHNVMHVLRQHPEMAGRWSYDEFGCDIHVEGELPWRREAGKLWDEDDMLDLACWMQGEGGGRLPTTVDTVQRVLPRVARDRRFHAVRRYLDGLEWDGVERIDHWLHDYTDAADDPFTRMVSRRFLLSMVARGMDAGCKVDTMLFLEGEQGAAKSAFCEVLGEPWSTDDLAPVGDKDAVLQIRRRWVVEVAELVAFSKKEATLVKAFLSRRIDRIRPPYAKDVVEQPRSCVFVGTTNQDVYLTDETGNRRIWPVRLTEVRLDELRRVRDQLLAEAVAAWRAGGEGARWWMDRHRDPPELLSAVREAQDDRLERDVWEPDVLEWLRTTVPWGRQALAQRHAADRADMAARVADGVTTAEALAALELQQDAERERAERSRRGVELGEVMQGALSIGKDRRDQASARRVARIMRAAGWRPKRSSRGVARGYPWWAPDDWGPS